MEKKNRHYSLSSTTTYEHHKSTLRGEPLLTSGGVTSGKIPAERKCFCFCPSVLWTIFEIVKVPLTLVGLTGNSFIPTVYASAIII